MNRSMAAAGSRGSLFGRCQLWALLVLVLGAAACSAENDKNLPSLGVARQAVASTQTIQLPASQATVSIVGPVRTGTLSNLVLASNSLTIGSRVEVQDTQGKRVSVANVGTGSTSIQPDTTLSNLFSMGSVELRDRVIIEKDVTAASLTQGNSDTIGGKIKTPGTADLAEPLSWTVTFPAGTFSSYNANPSDVIDIAPGRYGDIRVATNAVLKLKSGSYQFESLDLEPSAQVSVNATPATGPTTVYIRNSFIHRGARQDAGDPASLLFIHLGEDPVYVESPLFGGIVSPYSDVTLRQTQSPHRGAVLGKNVVLDSGTTLRARPPLALLSSVQNLREDKCAWQIPVPVLPFTKAVSVQFQYDLLRYCIAPDMGEDTARVKASSSVDITESAVRAVNGDITFCQYYMFRADRHKRQQAVENDPTLAALIAGGHDADDDLVPDATDACPNTPMLMPVDDQGCPRDVSACNWDDTAIRNRARTSLVVASNPTCADQLLPAIAPAGSVIVMGKGDAYLFASKIANDHPGCPIFYEFQFRMTDLSTGKVAKDISLLFGETEGSETGTLAPLPKPFLEFHISANDGGNRGDVVRLRQTGLRGWFRVRAINGQLAKGPFSAWRLTTVQDCNTVNIACSG